MAALNALHGLTLPHPLADVLRAAVIVVGFLLAALLLRLLTDRYLRRRQMRPDTVFLVRRVVYTAVLVIGSFVLLSDVFKNQLVGLSGILVAALIASLGLQDIFKSYVSGFYVQLERNVRVGDLIEVDGHTGIVTEVRMRVTFLQAADGSQVVIPNADLFGQALVVRRPKLVEGPQDDADQGIESSGV
ncbi:MAG TPA: mechanosensitive ion channel domain-containing protein [Candidatus Acidoferrales bacterium]|nr:mechanosensitive ion channel domain-containing protein [Candidatus Acidoferrales bacterium]